MRMLMPSIGLFAVLMVASRVSRQETPETKPAAVCPAIEGPAVKTEKDVRTQPFCDPTPPPKPEPTKPSKQVEK